jgi:uncharacterized protein YqgC (DUF456 family)
MLYFWITLLIMLNGFWLILTLFVLPGNWLIVITTALFAWWQWEHNVFSIYTLIAIAVLAFSGEVVEFFAGAGGAKKAGAGWLGAIAAIFGAITGAVIGTIVLPLFGTILGACLGAGLAATVVELAMGKTTDASIRSGFGASLGHLIGSTAKLAIGVALWLIVAIAAFWP